MTDTGTTSADTAPSEASNIPRKRKAEELSDDSGDPAAVAAEDADQPAHLPAPVWGHVLDFMPYADVRSALLVGKHMAVEAAKHVQTINITKAGEMYIPAARRFANAEEVNLLCLLGGTGETDDEDEVFEPYTITEVASTRIPSFISSFPKLKSVFLGGVLLVEARATNVRYGSIGHTCVGPDNHREVFRNLIISLFGAFKTGALRRDVELNDLLYSIRQTSPCTKTSRDLDTSPCQSCRDCIQYLPLCDVIIAAIYNLPYLFCPNTSTDVIWRLLSERPGIEMGINCTSEEVLCRVVRRELKMGLVTGDSESAVKLLSQKWRFDCKIPVMQVCCLPESAFERLDGLIKRGLDPGKIRSRSFFEMMGHLIGPCLDQFRFFVWTKSAVEGLAACGFPVNCDSIPVIEDRLVFDTPIFV